MEEGPNPAARSARLLPAGLAPVEEARWYGRLVVLVEAEEEEVWMAEPAEWLSGRREENRPPPPEPEVGVPEEMVCRSPVEEGFEPPFSSSSSSIAKGFLPLLSPALPPLA